jgi:hypothetical protein
MFEATKIAALACPLKQVFRACMSKLKKTGMNQAKAM